MKKAMLLGFLAFLLSTPAQAQVKYSQGSLLIDGYTEEAEIITNGSGKMVTIEITTVRDLGFLNGKSTTTETFEISLKAFRKRLAEQYTFGTNFNDGEVETFLGQIDSSRTFHFQKPITTGLSPIVLRAKSVLKKYGKEIE